MAGAEIVANILKKRASTATRQRIFKDLLKVADKNDDGAVSYEEYCEVIKENGVDMDKQELLKLFMQADQDRDGKIETKAEDIRAKAKAAFEAYDANKDNLVSPSEMARISGTRLNRQQIRLVFQLNDEDRDGYLNRNEMLNMMKRGSAGKPRKHN